MTSQSMDCLSTEASSPQVNADDEWSKDFIHRACKFVQVARPNDGLYDLVSSCRDFVGERPRKVAKIVDVVKAHGHSSGLHIVTHEKWRQCLQAPPLPMQNPVVEPPQSGFEPTRTTAASSPQVNADDEWYKDFVHRACKFVQGQKNGLCDLGSFCRDFVEERPRKIAKIEDAIKAHGQVVGLTIIAHPTWGKCLHATVNTEATTSTTWWVWKNYVCGTKCPYCELCDKWITEEHLKGNRHLKRWDLSMTQPPPSFFQC